MRRPDPALRIKHHRTGIEVKIGYRRSWQTTLTVALRLMRARVYAHDKGLATVLESDADWEVQMLKLGEFVGVAKIEGTVYTVTFGDDPTEVQKLALQELADQAQELDMGY